MAKRGAGKTFWASFLRFWLNLFNAIVALLGLAMLGYAVKMFVDVKHARSPPSDMLEMLQLSLPSVTKKGSTWFIWAFGGTGLFTFVCAASGLIGVAANSPRMLALYSVLLCTLLLGQAFLGVAFFADDTWRKHLPPDASGEAAQIDDFVHHKLSVCKWVALGALILQGCLLFLAYHLSIAQLEEIAEAGDEEDRQWGRQALLQAQARHADGDSEAQTNGAHRGNQGHRSGPWAARMQDKYGLDVRELGGSPGGPPGNLPERPPPEAHSTRCSIM